MSQDKNENEKKPVTEPVKEENKTPTSPAKPVEEEKKESPEVAALKASLDEMTKKAQTAEAKFEEADKNTEMWKNKYYSVYADMANTRKQIAKENDDFKKYAQQGVIEELIPALDGFDMALKKSPDDEAIKKYLEGFKMINEKILGVLKSLNVEIIEPKPGDEYDPNRMNAFSTIDGKEDNKVADVFLRGYKLHDHLLRPAGVVITKKAEVKEEKKDDKKIDVKDGKTQDKPKSQENK
ncbi:MAG: nucleotide exchange factor GrpE [Bacilli bacterium]